MDDRFTFAVVGHNEEATLANAVAQVSDAVESGDEVWYIDSASTDRSAAVADSLGVSVVSAPLGKGRAMATALARCRDGYMCFVDADLEASEVNIPQRLREVAAASGADMVVGAFHEPKRRLAVTPGLYLPLLRSLFPERVDDLSFPLSGFRALRTGLPIRPLPPGYGAETHLNVEVPSAGCQLVECELGVFQGNLRDYANIPTIGTDVAAALLDLGEAHGRLAPAARPAWNAWAADVVAVLRSQPPVGADDSAYVEDLLAAAARPLPSTRSL
ncbi:MAG: glycosyltransferase [Acidimicrobiia bacterium]